MQTQKARFIVLRKPVVTLDALQVLDGELALEADGQGNLRLGDGATLGGHKILAIVDRSTLSEGDSLQWRGGMFVRVARGAAVADVDDSSLPADGSIAGLTFSASPTQAECQALRDQCENLRDALAQAIATIDTLKSRLKVTGGSGTIAD